MAFPPSALATDKTNATPVEDDHKDHHNAIAAAVNDTVTELVAHEADTTNVHGITNTANLETTSGAQSKADAKVTQTITNGVTTTAPSEDAVFDALALKAALASPTLTGTPAAPTAAAGTSTTQIATTAFVQGERAKVVSSSAGDITAISTTIETDLIALTLPSNPAVGELYVAEFAGTMLNNVGSNQNLTVKFYLGTTAYMASGSLVIGTSASTHQWRSRIGIYIVSSTVQEIWGDFTKAGAAAAGTWGAVTAAATLVGWAQGAENTGTSKTVKLTATLQSGGGSQSMTASVGSLYVIRP